MLPIPFITPAEKTPCPRLFRHFHVENARSVRLAITGLGLYRAHINGARVGDDYLTPGFNDYDAWLPVQTYDISSLMRPGDNLIEVYLGNGWYAGRFGLDGGETNIWGGDDLLAARVTQGEVTLVETDESWRASLSPVAESGIYDGEVRDDTRDITKTVACRVIDAGFPQEMDEAPPVRVFRELPAKLIVTPKGEQVLDFGQNMAGIVRFHSRMRRGQTLRLQFGETLQGGCFYRENLRTAKAAYTYTSDGVEKDVEPWFTYFGFRYVLVDGLETVCPDDFSAMALCAALPEVLSCETDSVKLNRLMQNALWGQRSNFISIPTDCPQRDERLGWTADAQAFCPTAMYQMDCRAFYRKYIRDMREDQTRYYGGDVPMYSPSLKGKAGRGGAVWADAAVVIPWEVYQTYGERERLREAWPLMRDYTQTLLDADARLGGTHICFDGLTFGDWLALDGMTPRSFKGGTDDAFIQGVSYLRVVGLTARAAGALGNDAEESRLQGLAEDIRRALLNEYVTPGGNLCVDTQTGYVLALRFGLWRDRAKMAQGLYKRLCKDAFAPKTGFAGTPFLLPVLFDNGMADMAYRLLFREDYPGWLYAVNLGATTVWERWNSVLPDGAISDTGMNSLNHYAYGSVCEAIYSRIAGLRRAGVGWRRALIAPHINARVKRIRLSYDSPAGTYAVAWEIRRDGRVCLEASVPDECSALVRLPDHPQSAEFTVGQGVHTYDYRPTVDYLHPFSVRSPLTDLLSVPEAETILREQTPSLYQAVAAPDFEFRVQSPLSVAERLPYLDVGQVLALDASLREISL